MNKLIVFFLFACNFSAVGQKTEFTRADSLRGTLNQDRSYDVRFYDLNLRIDPENQYIEGYNRIVFSLSQPLGRIQLDLFRNMRIESAVYNNKLLPIERDENIFYVVFPDSLNENELHSVTVYYGGRPVVSDNPPWDGGFVWSRDRQGAHWIGVACQGDGASLWWPNKDHLSDEPDSMRITVTVPGDLVCVSNGRSTGKKNTGNGETTYTWSVSYPINNYNATVYIGNYARFSDFYLTGSGDTLLLDYYPLHYNLAIAEKHFGQVKKMLRVFEDLFGPYPFINDGYKLVEAPYWGMEHQSAVAYGNNYKNNEFGFDFIIVHESGHEYWGNSITAGDLGQMWIHEAFTTYMESLLVEKENGYDSALLYLRNQKENIKNNMAIQQPTGVNFHDWPDPDMYYKGTWMLHTLRNVIDDDSLWFSILKDLHEQYKISIVSADDMINFIDDRTNEDLRTIFDQYLNYPQPPRLLFHLEEKGSAVLFSYKWEAEAPGFSMPLKIQVQGSKPILIRPSGAWNSIKIKNSRPGDIILPHDYYYFLFRTAPTPQ